MFMLGITASRIGSVALANIIYNMDTFNVDVSNLRTIDNAGSEGAIADGLMYGSNHIYLGATQSVDIPLEYTLGAEEVLNGTFTTDLSSWTYNATYWTWDASGRAYHPLFNVSSTLAQTFAGGTKTRLVSLDVDITSGAGFSVADADGLDTLLITSTGSHYKIMTGDRIFINRIFDAAGVEGYVDNVSAKEITFTTQSVLYYDIATKQHVSVTSFTDIKHRMTTSFSNLVRLSVVPTAGDLTALNANPEDIARMVKGVATVGTYSFALADIQAFYPGDEGEAGGANIYDVTDGTWATFSAIVNYTATCRTTYKNTNYGASNFLYTQDATGRLTGMHTAGHLKSGTDGRNITIAMTAPYNHVVTKDIDKIEGSLTSCTITYSDTTTLVVP